MRSILICVFAGLCFSLAGCATAPTPRELAEADYGTVPLNYEQTIRSYMAPLLKDPQSAQYDFLNIPRRWYTVMGGKKYGWAVCVNINSKNSFGGYVGNRMYFFMINNDQVISSILGDGTYPSAMASGMCKNLIN